MKVFLTGATGFIGSHIIPELIQAGHQVLGLTRSEEGARALQAAGAQVHHGNLEDLESLRSGAAQSDGVIHCGFNHDFSKFQANCEQDRLVIQTLGAALRGTDRPLITTSGTGFGASQPGELATEDHPARADNHNPRVISELAAVEVQKSGINVSIVRLPQVHDPVKQGLVTYLVQVMREKGFSAYVGDGANRWPAAHVLDVARLYRLAVEKAEPGAIYNAVGEEGISAREIAEALGKGFGVPAKSISPDEAAGHFGWLGMFVAVDMPASSALTRKALNWEPTGPGLLADLAAMDYGKA